MKVHFIAIGGSAMHNLAIALHLKGYHVTGSDDEIFDPARSKLAKYGLLPSEIGWFPQKIDSSIDAIILGMHARADNPELLEAQALNLKIYSYPEFLYEQSKDKIRIVVGGSHGKTSITAMIIHVLQKLNVACDYMVGAQLAGFEVMVKLSDEAPIIVIEGDEYLTSPLDLRPKFHVYRPTIGIISGIAWDHINVFPTFQKYIEQFEIFAKMIPDDGKLIYCAEDPIVKQVANKIDSSLTIPYSLPAYFIQKGVTFLQTEFGNIPLKIFGKHNLLNLQAAKLACEAVNVSEEDFYRAIQSFKGASKRLELIAENEWSVVYKDFAHSPSKLKATVEAVKEQYSDFEIVACMELHTFSSLTEGFLGQYEGCMDAATIGIIFFDPHAIKHKKLAAISESMIINAFKNEDLFVFSNSEEMKNKLLSLKGKNRLFLLMSSGNFGGINIDEFAKQLLYSLDN
ncbi:MAG TPA: Mur ligase family protein [Bacteroidales bacterium]|nr:Mur ligase family protein [Bacteroidales bacterium]HXK73774.1 Mur ligase family protein [Bacteroidales bacterium]